MTDTIAAPDRAPGDIPDFDHARAEAAIRELLAAIGEDPDREGLRDTPARVARAYAELTAGLRMSAEEVLTTTFDLGHDEMVLVRDIELWSMCEHHLVPFTGARSPGCRSWRGSSTSTPSGRRCRSASPRRSPTR